MVKIPLTGANGQVRWELTRPLGPLGALFPLAQLRDRMTTSGMRPDLVRARLKATGTPKTCLIRTSPAVRQRGGCAQQQGDCRHA